MATINVTEYRGLAQIGTHTGQFPGQPAVAYQNHTLSTTSTTSNTFNADTRMIEISADAVCFVTFGAAAPITASTTNGTRLLTGETKFYGVAGGTVMAAVGIA